MYMNENAFTQVLLKVCLKPACTLRNNLIFLKETQIYLFDKNIDVVFLLFQWKVLQTTIVIILASVYIRVDNI